jgi:hypothetical protein
MNFDDDKLREGFERMMESIRRAQEVAVRYELAEGFIYQRPDGMYAHTTPEMLDIDIETNFNGLEDVIAEINAMFGIPTSL